MDLLDTYLKSLLAILSAALARIFRDTHYKTATNTAICCLVILLGIGTYVLYNSLSEPANSSLPNPNPQTTKETELNPSSPPAESDSLLSQPPEKIAESKNDPPSSPVKQDPSLIVVPPEQPKITQYNLKMSSFPSRATVIIDGVNRGTTDITVPITEGEHKIKLELSGYESYEQSIRLDKDTPPFHYDFIRVKKR